MNGVINQLSSINNSLIAIIIIKESNRYTYKCKKCLKEKTAKVKDIKDY